VVTLPSSFASVSLEGHTGGFLPPSQVAIHPGICHKCANTGETSRFEKKIEQKKIELTA